MVRGILICVKILLKHIDKNTSMMYSTYCVVINAICASGSVVERLLAKEKVAGSIPVSRLFFCKNIGPGCNLYRMSFCE